MEQERFPGDLLQQCRVERGLSQQEVAAQTKIPPHHLNALEQGTLDALPARCYGRGFLKTYCRFLALDPAPVLEAYDRVTQQANRPFGYRGSHNPVDWISRRFPDVITWLTIYGIFAFAWLAYDLLVHPHSEVTDGRVEAGTIEMVVPPTPFGQQWQGAWPNNPPEEGPSRHSHK